MVEKENSGTRGLGPRAQSSTLSKDPTPNIVQQKPGGRPVNWLFC